MKAAVTAYEQRQPGFVSWGDNRHSIADDITHVSWLDAEPGVVSMQSGACWGVASPSTGKGAGEAYPCLSATTLCLLV